MKRGFVRSKLSSKLNDLPLYNLVDVQHQILTHPHSNNTLIFLKWVMSLGDFQVFFSGK